MNRKGKFLLSVLLLLVMVVAAIPASGAEQTVKNVILMVPDGTGITHTTLSRWYQGGTPLAMDEIAAGLVRTYSAESAITDSAPAATAMATGFKSNDEFVSVLPAKVTMPGVPPVAEGDKYKPVASVLEGAKLMGKATGLVATKSIQDATPAAFSAHIPDRRNAEAVTEQQVYQWVDVVLGGGYIYLLPKNAGGSREDGQDQTAVLKSKGYDVVTNSEQMNKSTSLKLWGLFAGKSLPYDFDRDKTKVPSLAEMTGKAISILAQKPEGFFLLVEGSQIDMASHANDPVGVISETLAFDRAVRVALDFAKKDGNTLLIIAADHSNGGMSIGSSATNKGYDKTDISKYLMPLKKAVLTGAGVEAKLNPDKTNIAEVMANYYGINDLTGEEIKAIASAKPGELNYTVGPMISKRSLIGWTTTGHTGEDTALYSYGPSRPMGVIDNTEIARIIAGANGFSLDELNKKLFIPARKAFESMGATVSYNGSDPLNPAIDVVKGNIKMNLPINTSMVIINGEAKYMQGLTVMTADITYVPQEAIDILTAATTAQ